MAKVIVIDQRWTKKRRSPESAACRELLGGKRRQRVCSGLAGGSGIYIERLAPKLMYAGMSLITPNLYRAALRFAIWFEVCLAGGQKTTRIFENKKAGITRLLRLAIA
jgi:hypothetical protein